MSFPVTGLLLLLVSVYFFFFVPRLLYLGTVFLIPFTAMAVVNISWGGGEKGIPAWIFMGTLWILRTAISRRPFWRHLGWRLTRRARWELLALLSCGFISLLVPLIVNGSAWIEQFGLYSNQTTPLTFSSERITQTAYFAFGVIFVIFVAVENCDPQRLRQSVRAYVSAAVFASVWAFVQLWCILTGHAYPASLFNNSMGTSAQLYTEQLSALDLHRVSSVATEPSIFAFSMLLAFIVLLMAIGLRQPVFSRGWDVSALLLVTMALIISTSTTAYAGLVLASCVGVILLARAGVLRWLYVGLTAAAAAFGIFVALQVPLVRNLVELVIVNKGQGYSARERLHTVELAAHYFMRYPLFGVSWNAARSSDLVVEVLASLGIVGFTAFSVFLADELCLLWKAPARGSSCSISIFAAVCLMLALSEATGIPYAMGFLWFTLGLGLSAPFIVERSRIPALLAERERGAWRGLTSPGPAQAGVSPQ